MCDIIVSRNLLPFFHEHRVWAYCGGDFSRPGRLKSAPQGSWAATCGSGPRVCLLGCLRPLAPAAAVQFDDPLYIGARLREGWLNIQLALTHLCQIFWWIFPRSVDDVQHGHRVIPNMYHRDIGQPV